jgi:hypothetical protein
MNITDLAYFLGKYNESLCESNYICMQCNNITATTSNISYYIDLQRSDLNIVNTDSVISVLKRLFYRPTSKHCNLCNAILCKNTCFKNAPTNITYSFYRY